jgi:hypothetical protein
MKSLKSASKTLSLVEARPDLSNQHELNGVSVFKSIFGSDRFTKSAVFSTADGAVTDTANITWYDSREAHETRSEYRLYFQTNRVMDMAEEGDTVTVELDAANQIRVIITPK